MRARRHCTHLPGNYKRFIWTLHVFGVEAIDFRYPEAISDAEGVYHLAILPPWISNAWHPDDNT